MRIMDLTHTTSMAFSSNQTLSPKIPEGLLSHNNFLSPSPSSYRGRRAASRARASKTWLSTSKIKTEWARLANQLSPTLKLQISFKTRARGETLIYPHLLTMTIWIRIPISTPHPPKPRKRTTTLMEAPIDRITIQQPNTTTTLFKWADPLKKSIHAW